MVVRSIQKFDIIQIVIVDKLGNMIILLFLVLNSQIIIHENSNAYCVSVIVTLPYAISENHASEQ